MNGHKSKALKTYTEADLLKEKVKLLDLILGGLCSKELNQDGRDFVNRLKYRFNKTLENEFNNP